jgi:hypothetical protein
MFNDIKVMVDTSKSKPTLHIQDGLDHGEVMYKQGRDHILLLLDIESWGTHPAIKKFVSDFIAKQKES